MELSSARHVNGQLDEKQCSNVSRSISQTSVHNYTSKARHKSESRSHLYTLPASVGCKYVTTNKNAVLEFSSIYLLRV